jgi:sugar-specific transcriptional regulator TrmB
LSLERVIKTLEGFGLKRMDAEVYIYLAKKGPLSAGEVATALKLSNQKFYHILKNLQEKGVVISNLGHPTVFSALPLAEVLELYIIINARQAQIIKETKEELLASWQSIIEQNNT